jgi:hypothetical protein
LILGFWGLIVGVRNWEIEKARSKLWNGLLLNPKC